jgi:hypothetical protein
MLSKASKPPEASDNKPAAAELSPTTTAPSAVAPGHEERIMPKFFFHLHNDIYVHDEVGTELPSLDDARSKAVGAARGVMAEDIVDEGQITLSHRITIANEAGAKMLELPFRACVEIRP